MGIRLALSVMASLAGMSVAAAAQEPDPAGIWMRDDGNAKVRIAPCGSSLCATNLWIRDTSGGEEVGDRLIMSLEPRTATSLAGRAYDPKRKLSYSVTVTVGQRALMTRGCIVGGLICKNVSWTPSR